MSDTMAASPAGSVGHAAPTAYRRARAALAAEWIKLRSLRAMLVTPLVAAVVCIGLANLVCSNYVANWSKFDAARKTAFEPLDVNFNFVQIGILFFGALGALVVTNEYGNGLIRTTLAATPQRGLVLAAKAVLLGLVALVLAVVICFTAFLTGQGVLSGHVPHVSLGDPGVLGRVMGMVYYCTAGALIGLFVGVLVRSSAAAISGVFALMLALPSLVNGLPHSAVWRHTVPYLPSNLGVALWYSPRGPFVSQGTATLGLAVYVIVLAAAAAFLLRGRDA